MAKQWRIGSWQPDEGGLIHGACIPDVLPLTAGGLELGLGPPRATVAAPGPAVHPAGATP